MKENSLTDCFKKKGRKNSLFFFQSWERHEPFDCENSTDSCCAMHVMSGSPRQIIIR